jgi:hypothetical protein
MTHLAWMKCRCSVRFWRCHLLNVHNNCPNCLYLHDSLKRIEGHIEGSGTFSVMTLSIMTLIITILGKLLFSKTTLNITMFSIIILSIMMWHSAKQHSNVFKLAVVMPQRSLISTRVINAVSLGWRYWGKLSCLVKIHKVMSIQNFMFKGNALSDS